MVPFKAFSKQLLGARYEHITRSIITSLIIFFAFHTSGLRINIASNVLSLTAMSLSLGAMWRAAGSAQNEQILMGIYALPFDNRRFIASYLMAFGGYILIVRFLPVLALFLAASDFSALEILLAVLCAVNGCVLATAWYSSAAVKRAVAPFSIWICGVILVILFERYLPALYAITVLSLVSGISYLLFADAYVFYRPVPARKLTGRTDGKCSVILYLLRYMTADKNCLFNTLGLCAAAYFFPFMFGQLEGLNALPIGLAILCINTPVCVLLSCDPELERAVRTLPGQSVRFGIGYCVFIFIINMTIYSVYLFSWQLQNGGIGWFDIIAAILFAVQNAILSVLLEWRYPIRDWKTVNDLWRHPRKYIAPLIMLLIAVPVGTWRFTIWIMFWFVFVECLMLLRFAKGA